MSDTELMSTAAQEAIRIADKYLPNAHPQQRMFLAKEIIAAISLCERELGDEIIRRSRAITGGTR